MSGAEKNRLRQVLWTLLAVLGAGLFYAWVLIPAGVRLPCRFRRVTGWKCPGCGMTDLCLALLRGDLAAAFAYNRAVFAALPVLGVLLGLAAADYVRPLPQRAALLKRILTAALLALLLVWGAVRNAWGI